MVGANMMGARYGGSIQEGFQQVFLASVCATKGISGTGFLHMLGSPVLTTHLSCTLGRAVD